MGKTFSDIYTEVSRKVRDTTATFIASDVCPTINDVCRSIFQKMNYAFKERTADLTLVASQGYVAVPTDWDEMSPVQIFYRDSANERQDLDCFDNKEWQVEQDNDEGDVYGFHISKISGAWRIYFTLIPDSSFVASYSPLKIEYSIKWTELVKTTNDATEPDIPDSHRQLIVYRACEILCGQMGDTEGAIFWKSEADKEEGLLNKKQVNRLGRSHRVRPNASITTRGFGYRRRDYSV